MKRNFFLPCILILAALSLFVSCSKDAAHVKPIPSELNLRDVPYDYVDQDFVNVANSFNSNIPFDNQMDNDKVTLGRVLFYDTRLSLNNSVSCASCHHQRRAFAADRPFSTGFEGRTTTRNSPPVMNMVLSSNFFWDASQQKLEDMVLMPIRNHLEMGIADVKDLELKLKEVDYYPSLFEKAFGTETVSANRISKALAQFVRSLISTNSKFDKGQVNGFANFSPLEKMGFDLFNSARLSCGACHGGFNFSGWNSDAANIGLDIDYEDNGIANGMFKVPSLRNVALTAPYMHDGRFATLEEVVDHYDQGIQAHPNLDFRLREGYPNVFAFEPNIPVFTDPFTNTIFIDGVPFDFNQFTTNIPPKRLNLTDVEKQALVAFLKTLSDEQFVKDEKFSNPFVQ